MAGGKNSTFQNQILRLILNGIAIPNIADNAASAPLTQFWLSLHTADPGAGGAQNTSEAAYLNYARVAVARSSSGLTISGNAAVLAAAAIFPTAGTGANETEIFAALGIAQTGPGQILYRGPITPSLTVTVGVGPQLTTGTTLTES